MKRLKIRNNNNKIIITSAASLVANIAKLGLAPTVPGSEFQRRIVYSLGSLLDSSDDGRHVLSHSK